MNLATTLKHVIPIIHISADQPFGNVEHSTSIFTTNVKKKIG